MTSSGAARALLPREHGAYAYVAFPLVGGLLMARPTLAAVAFAVAAVAFFLAHEPLAVLLGSRGQRLRTSLGDAARGRLPWLFGIGIGAGIAAFVTAPPLARAYALVPLSLGLALVPAVVRRRQKTLLGEIVVLAAFSTMVLPLAVASGVPAGHAWAVAGVWMAGFLPPTVAVHALKARHRAPDERTAAGVAAPLLALLVLLGGPALALLGPVPWNVGVAPTPLAAVTLAVVLRPFHPKHLKRLGWSLVAAGVLTLVLTLLG